MWNKLSVKELFECSGGAKKERLCYLQWLINLFI